MKHIAEHKKEEVNRKINMDGLRNQTQIKIEYGSADVASNLDPTS